VDESWDVRCGLVDANGFVFLERISLGMGKCNLSARFGVKSGNEMLGA